MCMHEVEFVVFMGMKCESTATFYLEIDLYVYVLYAYSVYGRLRHHPPYAPDMHVCICMYLFTYESMYICM